MGTAGGGLADWEVDDTVTWEEEAATFGTNEDCPTFTTLEEDGDGGSAYAEVKMAALKCNDEEHDEHEAGAIHARQGIRQVHCEEEDEPGAGTIDATGTRYFYRFAVTGAGAESAASWRADWLPDGGYDHSDQTCNHLTEQQLTPILEADWVCSCQGSGLENDYEAELVCTVGAVVQGPGHPQAKTAGAYHSTGMDDEDFVVDVSPE
ncbi:MAG: hypothetical protein PVH68_16225 [Armatimonadota bacterium]